MFMRMRRGEAPSWEYKPSRRERWRWWKHNTKQQAYEWAGISEAVMPSITWRFWLVRVAFTPNATARYLRHVFQKATVLPGDRFQDFQRFEWYEVVAVRTDFVTAMMYRGPNDEFVGVIKAWRPGKAPANLWDNERERSMEGWLAL